MSALREAIFAKLAGTPLATAIGGRMVPDQAPAGTALPFVTYSCPDDTPIDRVFVQTRVSFSISSASPSPSEVDDVEKKLRAVFDDCSLSAAGLNANCGLEFDQTVRIPPDETGVRMTVVDYLIWIER